MPPSTGARTERRGLRRLLGSNCAMSWGAIEARRVDGRVLSGGRSSWLLEWNPESKQSVRSSV